MAAVCCTHSQWVGLFHSCLLHHLFGGRLHLVGWLGWLAASLGGRLGPQAWSACVIDRSFVFFPVFRGMDGLVTVVGLR